jgi:hypothetical protein
MSRSQYTDECDGWDLIRYRGAVRAAMRGRRGQELLHGLASALDALPDKQLIAGDLITDDGDVCTLGALGVVAGRIAAGRADALRQVDPEDYEQVAKFFGVAEALVREVMYENDEYRHETSRARWRRMRAWVERHIQRDEEARG